MGRLFPMDRNPLLGLLIVTTFAFGVFAGPVLGLHDIMAGVFVTGYLLVLVVALLGDSLSMVADSDEAGIWRRMGREFSKGRNLADDEQVDPGLTDLVEKLRAAYVSGDIDEAEFERRLDDLFEAEDPDSREAGREPSLDVE